MEARITRDELVADRWNWSVYDQDNTLIDERNHGLRQAKAIAQVNFFYPEATVQIDE